MILMENGRMDSNSKIPSEPNHFIMDLGGKSAKSCLNNGSPVTFQNVNNNSISSVKNISAIENNFSNCNGTVKLDHCETLTLLKRNDTCVDCDENSFDNPKRTNSSQCSLSCEQNSVCGSLETDLSKLSVNVDSTYISSESISERCSDFNCSKCDKSFIKGEHSKGSVEDCNSTCENEQTVDLSEDPHAIENVGQNSDYVDLEKKDDSTSEVMYISYESENQMPDIMKLIQKDLSEPYSIYTYRYFIHNWPHLCFLAICKGKSVGAIVCKLDLHRKVIKRGYIAMLAVDECYRKQGIGSNLVLKAIRVMAAEGADEVVLETEITNQPALRLYENLGFVRDKRLFRYYLNGVDALRLKLWLR